MKKIKIALTGGIGTGKSTVAKLIADEGFTVINADKVAKDILVEDNYVIQKVKKQFGDKAYSGRELNKQFLAEKVFNDPNKLAHLNSIVHPPTISKIEALADKVLENNNFVFVESALIFEANMDELFDYIILVSCDDETRINRVIERDGITKQEVEVRIENQLNEKAKKSESDFIINNDSTLEELSNRVKLQLSILKAIAL